MTGIGFGLAGTAVITAFMPYGMTASLTFLITACLVYIIDGTPQ